MSFVPVVPIGGYAGWRFLERTLDRQEASHAGAPAAQRDEAYFRQNIGAVGTAAELVADRRLLRTALAAFGLTDDLPNRAFIQRVLESQTSDRGSFVNRLTDKRYLELAQAFGFGDGAVPHTRDAGVVAGLLQRARETRFEEAVGAQDGSMRLALALQRDLRRLAAQPMSEEARWYTLLGTPSLRTVFETAFGLPKEFAALDLDRQIETLRARTERLTGARDLSQFADPEAMETLTRRFFVGAQLAEMPMTVPGSAALTLLQSAATTRLRPGAR